MEHALGKMLLTLTVANNFWGKDDAGVHPLLERMQSAKVTCDELKAFYNSIYTPERNVKVTIWLTSF